MSWSSRSWKIGHIPGYESHLAGIAAAVLRIISSYGALSGLVAGDDVRFADMEGYITEYKVVVIEVLAPTAIEEIQSGIYDLTLFTCNYGGKSKVVVGCDYSSD